MRTVTVTHNSVHRYPINELPASDTGLKEWVNDLWQQKEQTLIDFYCQRSFSEHPLPTSKAISNSLLLALLFWTGLIVLTIYGLVTSTYLQLWAVFHSTIFVVLSFTSEGIHQLEASWYKNKPVHVRH